VLHPFLFLSFLFFFFFFSLSLFSKRKDIKNILSDWFFLLRKMVKLKFYEYISLDKSEFE
jgi:hypothetical protein